MKKWFAYGLTSVMVLGGVYFGSPYYAAHSLRSAAADANTDKLEASVDFPAVREGLKSQLSAAVMTKMQNDPALKGNPFAGLGAAMTSVFVDRMVDSFVTADGIAALMRGQRPSDRATVRANSDVESHGEYVTLDRFRVRHRNKKSEEEGPTFLFERRGFATWKLIKLEMPPSLFEKSQ